MSTRRSELGKYRLEERLGKGGMAEVWRATLVGAHGFERPLAIKRIREHLAEDPEFVQMFLAEARLTAQLHHPNIVQILELGHEDNEYFLVMELVRGHDLHKVARWRAKVGRSEPGFAAYVVLEMARALAYAHSLPLGIIHRDVSPSNVMIGFDGSVKLLDFGVAKAAHSSVATRSGVLKGKLGYFSPEVVRGESPDQRADQFAAGVVLHELLTGKPLFRRESDVETLALVMQAEAAAPSAQNPAVPAALDAVCLRALAREPKDRFADCRELLAALEPIVHELGFSAPKLATMMQDFRPEPESAQPSSSASPPRRKKRRANPLPFVAAALAFVAGGMLVWWVRQPAAPVVVTADLSALPDLSAPPDLATLPDLAVLRDLSVFPDLRHHKRASTPPPLPAPTPPPQPTGLHGPVDPFAD